MGRLRAAERHFRKEILRPLGIRWVAGRLAKVNPAIPPDWKRGNFSVLFLRYDRIGDMIVSTGVLRALTSAYPNFELDVLASPVNAPVIAHEPYVRNVFVVDTKRPMAAVALMRELRRRHYDVVLDCQFDAPSSTSLALIWAIGAKYRGGLGGRGIDRAFNLKCGLHERHTHVIGGLAQLLGPFGLDTTQTYRPALHLTPVEIADADARWNLQTPMGGHRVLVNVTAGRKRREWPEEKYATALRFLRQEFPDVALLTVAPPDRIDLARRVAASVGTHQYFAPASIREALALVATADAVFTPDTSIAHAASCFRKPTVVMYQKDNWKTWGAYDAPTTDVVESPTYEVQSLPVQPVCDRLGSMVARLRGCSAESLGADLVNRQSVAHG